MVVDRLITRVVRVSLQGTGQNLLKQLVPLQASDEDVEIIPVLEFCVSHYMNYWLAAIFTYKGLLLVSTSGSSKSAQFQFRQLFQGGVLNNKSVPKSHKLCFADIWVLFGVGDS